MSLGATGLTRTREFLTPRSANAAAWREFLGRACTLTSSSVAPAHLELTHRLFEALGDELRAVSEQEPSRRC
jgi:pyrroloquinoline quinone (PQQ) biosynthesis protein C